MSVVDYILGGILILISIFMVVITLMQSQKDEGMTSAIGGTNNDSFYGKNSSSTREKALERLTKIVAFLFFAITIAVNIMTAFSK